mmetsp:Transcript_9797/g.24867  ORF Transcript_9797/g.24867 Transcript_9797/m.24867 type:complete len:981 (-) Transcript_9797:768-3710(-)|eukprot:CAMPEP_0197414264 /NCGR_PEP_ID=MMETSP1170-20131217/1014_1 /TAXON_ID=54406 /ORGANISM="Sarcinochrysis sp, Strain CCMP770" /LENGTH=980 /DNA_ID=CAMNT_0042940965 /DNA_START=169 /DNA_END=3111 /DNA_ORIENTATION=+
MSIISDNCTVLLNTEKQTAIAHDDILKQLEDSDDKVKLKSLKAAIYMMLSGEPMPKMLMTVIRFCINTEDHELKKLLMLFWEIVPKYDSNKKLLPEMILVCNALRNDLNHSNEFVRGCMLRFLCKLREAEIIEPLVPSIKACLEHRHSYVRKNAALAVYHIHKHHGHALVPDGAELMENFIQAESEIGSRRNAFLMLFNESEEAAIDFIASTSGALDRFGDGFALLVLELIRKVCRRDPQQKARFLQFLFQLLASPSAAVSYEAAWTLVGLSTSPTAVRAAAITYTTLLTSQSDNNVKLIVLERLAEIKDRDARTLTDVLMDLMRALTSPNIDICKRTLQIAMDLVSPRNIDEVMQVLKREILRTKESDLENGGEYRAMLIHSVHACAMKFPEVTSTIVHTLMEFLNVEGAMDVMIFVRAMVEQYDPLRSGILHRLIASLHEIKSSSVLAVALWVVGEYADSEGLESAFEEVLAAAGIQYVVVAHSSEGAGRFSSTTGVDASFGNKAVVLSDGTYASQTTLAYPGSNESDDQVPCLHQLIKSGDYFLGTVMTASLTKLALKSRLQHGFSSSQGNKHVLAALRAICEVARLIEFSALRNSDQCVQVHNTAEMLPGAYADCLERLALFTQLLLNQDVPSSIHTALSSDCKLSFSKYLEYSKVSLSQLPPFRSSQRVGDSSNLLGGSVGVCQPDDLISWRQLRPRSLAPGELDLCDGDDLMRAKGLFEASDRIISNSHHVYQLSGFADPVYAEAYVVVHDYDILLEVLVVNRTSATLTNLAVELNTMGDLKLVERPQSLTIGPHDQQSINANIKVSSTETGHIFGTIVYENSSTAEKAYVNLNNIHLDIMDYIRPAMCSDENFRSMWAEFEWENKVAITTAMLDLGDFLEHIVRTTNMTCLTPRSALGGESSFLAANLYAKSIFGEDALVNVSVEKKDDADGKLSGYIRIRSKTQGIALSLGDRITSVQRTSNHSDQHTQLMS